MVLDVVEGAEVNDHQVDHFQHEGDDSIGNSQSVVKVEVIVVR